jgi:hypothetical protein
MHGGDESTWRKQTPRCESSPSASTDSAEILKGILRHIESQRFKKCGFGRETFTSLGESDQTSVRRRIGSVVHAFIVASVLSILDVVRIEVEVQIALQGLRVAKKKYRYVRRSRTWRVGEGEEARQIGFTTRTKFVRSLHLITVNGHVMESDKTHKAKKEGPMRHERAWHGSHAASPASTKSSSGTV